MVNIREARKAGLAFSASSLDAPMSDKDDGALLSDMLGEDHSQMHVSRLLTRALGYLRHQLTSEPGRNTVTAGAPQPGPLLPDDQGEDAA